MSECLPVQRAVLSSDLVGKPKLVVRAAQLADLIIHGSRHLAMRAAVAAPVFASIRALQPRLALKYLNPEHLAIGLTSDARATAMIHHYGFLQTQMPATARTAIFGRGLHLWSCVTVAGCHRVDLVFSHPTDNEGELTLNYTLDDEILSVCSFTFMPGSFVQSADATIIAITRIQGVRADLARQRAATAALSSIAPAKVFLAALTGIADRLAISTIGGVTARAQVARAEGGLCTEAYDQFFEKIDGERVTPIFYRIALPLTERPLSEVKRNHRARTRMQRDVRAGIAAAASGALVG